MEPTTRHAAYLACVFEETDDVIERIVRRLEGRDYDTIVGTGISGALLLLKLRDRLKKHIAIVRKARDGSHSYNFVEGTLGARYVIVDDQVASGATVNHIVNTIRRQLIEKEAMPLRACPVFVGVACYVSNSEIEPWIDATDDRFASSRMEVPPTRMYECAQAVIYGGMDVGEGLTATELETVRNSCKAVPDQLLYFGSAALPMPQPEAELVRARYGWVVIEESPSPTNEHKTHSKPEEPEVHE